MKMKVFFDTAERVQNSFNKWAKGKKLTREVIIHTAAFPGIPGQSADFLAIIVIHPDDPEWDRTEETQ